MELGWIFTIINITFLLESQVHKCAQSTERLSTARYYESETQIQNGVNTSTVILLKTKCLVRFGNFFFWGMGITDLNRVANSR